MYEENHDFPSKYDYLRRTKLMNLWADRQAVRLNKRRLIIGAFADDRLSTRLGDYQRAVNDGYTPYNTAIRTHAQNWYVRSSREEPYCDGVTWFWWGADNNPIWDNPEILNPYWPWKNMTQMNVLNSVNLPFAVPPQDQLWGTGWGLDGPPPPTGPYILKDFAYMHYILYHAYLNWRKVLDVIKG
ncbi:MAG: hypothetical protein NTY09_07805 [bacterium]|nr:hypothetical protein [bacterium]